MCVCVCARACMHACMHVCVRACVRACVRVFVRAYVRAAVSRHGMSSVAIQMLTPGVVGRGPIELVEHFHDKCHGEWVKDLETSQLDGLTGTQKICEAVTLRLLKQGDVISSWPQALALQALPSNAPGAITALARTCDTACNLAGPTPIDGTWFRCAINVSGLAWIKLHCRTSVWHVVRCECGAPPCLIGGREREREEREIERERERKRERVCVCVSERERERKLD